MTYGGCASAQVAIYIIYSAQLAQRAYYMSKLEELFAAQLERADVKFERELMLIPGRRFRFDFVFAEHNLVAEIEGAIWTGGRHTSGAGFLKDCEKYNLLVEHGWQLLRFPTNLVRDGSALEQTLRVLRKDASEASQEPAGDDW